MKEVQGSLSDDQSTLTLTFARAPGFSLPMKANEIEELVNALATLRRQMYPPVEDDLPTSKVYRGVADPKIICEKDELREAPLIHVRHPGIGWLHFGFSAKRAREVGAYLLAASEAVATSRSKSRTN